MSKNQKDITPDLFEWAFPIHHPSVLPETVDLKGKIKRLVSLICKKSPKSREQITAKMAEIMDCPEFSTAMLNNYSSEANTTHQIPLYRFVVLCRVANASWAWEEIMKNEGFTLLHGEEALLAERGRVQQEMEELKRYQKELEKLAPVKIRRRI